MEHDRLNSPQTSAITLEALGHQLRFLQDPNSKHLGTTVWDASMVFAKFLEKNCRKGKFCPSKLKGKRVIELGAGCGVAGFGMAMLGCDVVLTDQKEVLSLLQRNVDYNTSSINQMNTSGGSFGSIKVAELDWGNMNQVQAVDPPFDFIIGTDVVYAEHLLEPLLQTILALSGPRTSVMMGYEIRCTTVHEQMLQLFKRDFDVKAIPKGKMHSEFQHPSIQLYTMTLRPSSGANLSDIVKPGEEDLENEEQNESAPERRGEDNTQADRTVTNDNGTEAVEELQEADNELLPRRGELSDWEVRRYGSMAARLLRDIKIT